MPTESRLRSWFTPRRRFVLAVAIPIAVTVFSQLGFVQNAECVVVQDFVLTLGECKVLADVIAPAWALAIIPIARRLTAAAGRYGTAAEHSESWLTTKLATRGFAAGCARAAQFGAALIITFSWTREWDRFGQQPDAEWYVLTILITIGLLVVPMWWIRDELHNRGAGYLSTGRLPERINTFLMDRPGGAPRRAPHVLAFSLVTLIVALVVLGQLDSLLRGMHPAGSPGTGISGLAVITEFDLSQKEQEVSAAVRAWREYTDSVGARFGSAYAVVGAHALIDTIATIPAYLSIGLTLVAYAWQRRQEEDPPTRRTMERVTLAGLSILLLTALFDVGKNSMSWFVMHRAWNDPDLLTDASVRILWFLSLFRTIGLAVVFAAGLVLLALIDTPLRVARRALVAARSEILVLAAAAGVILVLPQTADVIRGWRVSHTVITVALAVMLSMLVRWTAAANLRLKQRHWEQAEAGLAPEPPRLRLASAARPTLGRFSATLVVALTLVQLILTGLGMEAGRGLLIPAAIVAVLWLFGLALPIAPYARGDRPVPPQIRRRLPRWLGSMVYLIIGVAIIKAAASSLAYARHEDLWLLFALVPPAIGLWRIATRTMNTMGFLEAAFTGALVVVATVMLVTQDDPELSAAALAFAGVTFAYGSLSFFNSYEPESLVSKLSRRFLAIRWAQPFVAAAATALTITLVLFYLDPVGVGPRVGTIGMVLMATMPAVVVGAGAVRFAELTRPPRLLAAFGIKRTPVVILLLAWLLLAPAVVDQRTNDVRISSTGRDMSDVAFLDVWERWASNNLTDGGAGAGIRRPAVPLLLVSSSGGGLRAAAWTAFVLDCVFEAAPAGGDPCGGEGETVPPVSRVAVMSGVSGGSLGIATYVAHAADRRVPPTGPNTWIDDVLGDDYLAGPIGWLFFVDLPRSLLGFGTGISNRAELMERAWEASWPSGSTGLSRGLGELWQTHPEIPAVVFNGTSVNDGCRVNISALNVDGSSPEVPSCSSIDGGAPNSDGGLGATHDLVDFLCPGADLALSTAAGVSARFPVVSVAGRLAAEPTTDCPSVKDGAIFVVDGGYLEGSGAGTLLDAWENLRDFVEQHNATGEGACVVPFMLHIDNGYESAGVTGNIAVPREFLVPLKATVSSASGITAARAEAALAFEQPFTIGGVDADLVRQPDGVPVESRYARLVTRAHPGVEAPLGWTLSQTSIDDLRDQLAIDENVDALDEIRSWLDGTIECGAP